MKNYNKDLWDRSKDGDRREQRSFLRYAIIASTIFVFFLFVKKDNVITWISSAFTLSSQKRQIEKLKTDISTLEEEIKMMTENKDTLETLARERFLFAEPGDDVYVLESR